jgi:hypothetical protein
MDMAPDVSDMALAKYRAAVSIDFPVTSDKD